MGKYTLKLPNNYELKISSDLEGSIRSFVAKVEIVSKIEGEVSVTIEGYFLFLLFCFAFLTISLSSFLTPKKVNSGKK